MNSWTHSTFNTITIKEAWVTLCQISLVHLYIVSMKNWTRILGHIEHIKGPETPYEREQ